MSILRIALTKTCGSLSKVLLPANPLSIAGVSVNRALSTTASNCCQHQEEGEPTNERVIDPSKDRSIKIDVETSIRYLKSAAYKETYGDHLVWHLYRRNHKGGIPPQRTRKSCIYKDVIRTGSPCPICRDQYLVLHHTHLDLLKQFVSEHTGEVGFDIFFSLHFW